MAAANGPATNIQRLAIYFQFPAYKQLNIERLVAAAGFNRLLLVVATNSLPAKKTAVTKTKHTIASCVI